jgi:hypothetical protein
VRIYGPLPAPGVTSGEILPNGQPMPEIMDDKDRPN